LRRFALIHGVLRLGYNYSSSFSGKIYVPYIPTGFQPTAEDLEVPFGRQLEVGVGMAAAEEGSMPSSGGSGGERERESDLDTEAIALTKSFVAGEYCNIQVSTVGLPLFEN